MKKLIVATSLFVLFIVFALPAILSLPIKIMPFNDQPSYNVDNRISIYYNNVVTQKFISPVDNLTAIGMTIGNPNLANKKPIIFTLYDAHGEVIRTSLLSGMNIPDGAFMRFVFDPITSSKGQEYIFSIESPEAHAEDVIYVYHSKDKPIWYGETTFDNKIFTEGSLPFVAYFKPESKIALIKEIYSSWFKRFLGITN
jgi:hypothetical protein